MNVDVVVDIGNTRVKWGRCSAAGITAVASLPPDDPAAWQGQVEEWQLSGSSAWAVSGVHPQRCARMTEWLSQQGSKVWQLAWARQLPVAVAVERPDWVGIDRLLNAVAANRRRPAHEPAVIVDAGSAVTVDWVDAAGTFRGGTILPGIRLMTQALHDHTALLPIVEIREPKPPVLGTSTIAAMQSGIYYGVAGAISCLQSLLLSSQGAAGAAVFLTGGDARLLQPALDSRFIYWPEMTLEGVRLSAESQP